VNAKLMTYGAAEEITPGHAVDPASDVGRQSGRRVWFVFLRGDIVERGGAAAGQTTTSPPFTYRQESVILDATTGELLSVTMYTTTHEKPEAVSFPMVPVPSGLSSAMTAPPVLS
jgi:hypothetical protein